MAGGIGAILAVLGGCVALVRMIGGDIDEVFFGGLAVVACGLLLRIEQAIVDLADSGPVPAREAERE